ncbi:MAG TPA: hypothetical protein VGL53_00050 [Bryobacteraceae bacterium]|jgi:hypothetical protein
MGAIASILLSIALGCVLMIRFARLGELRQAPRWSVWFLVLGAGAACGMGLTSCLFFLLHSVPAPVGLILRLMLLAAFSYDCWRRRGNQPVYQPLPRPPYLPFLWIAFALSLLIVTNAMSKAWDANPQGNWDAWSIWNLRAKFLAAGGGLASRAWSPMLNFTHPEYPLLLSGLIASWWTDSGVISDVAPIAAAFVFFLALVLLVTGGIAALRGPTLGLLAGLCLMGIPALLTEASSQYADVPLACFMAGAVLFALLERPILAGVFAGFAAWTKDEGLLFLAVMLVAVAVWKRSALARFCCGAAPCAILALTFKLVIARGTHSIVSGASPLAALFDFGRWEVVAFTMVKEAIGWNIGWYHALLPLMVLALMLRFDARQMRDGLFCAGIACALLLGYFAVYVITPNDLSWQLQTSLTRLFVQVCPVVLIAAFIGMNAPPQPLAPVEPPAKKRKTKR